LSLKKQVPGGKNTFSNYAQQYHILMVQII